MRTRPLLLGLVAGTTVVAVGAVLAYPRFGRDRCLNWGSRADEVARAMPGDTLLTQTDIVSTRAVTIDAPVRDVWPWLVQMGPGRGGAYTYDWIENLLGLDMHSADRVLPQFQHLAVGDVMQLGDAGPTMRAAVVDPERALVFASDDGHWVWAFVLDADDVTGATRLISRNRILLPPGGAVSRAINTAVMEPGSLVMESKMLRGIKERAEFLRAQRSQEGGDVIDLDGPKASTSGRVAQA
jgi:hypothetical protein